MKKEVFCNYLELVYNLYIDSVVIKLLYKKGFIEEEKFDFLFDSEPYNEDIDFNEIAAIEDFYKKHGYVPEKYINSFLNWLTYKARDNITHPLESVLDSSFAGRCAVAQSFYSLMLDKLGFKHFEFNVGDIVNTSPIHALTCVEIPTMVDGESVNKLFILDPTFRQFCLSEENRFERYNEEKRWGVNMATPHPGYFFNLTPKGRSFAKDLIHFGYFEVTDSNIKTYFDPFSLYVTPKEEYDDERNVGMISNTNYSGMDYWDKIINNTEKPLHGSRDFDLSTPREDIENRKKKLGYKIRKLFRGSELDEMFIIDDQNNRDNNKFTKN